ncbi:MAG TPA: alkaline phosphatase family protein [Solirubrobacteraceae bacterium]|nr:alkaline phosphatase family protein [Solirubrobacteraceae bacterium]
MSHRRPIRSALAIAAVAVAWLGALAGPAGATTAVNLLRNAGAETGAASVHGWDAVTIPGWGIASGLPTVARYGDHGFPAGRGQLFVGGAGGTARLVQTVVLARRHGGPLPAGSAYALSAELGGTTTSRAGVSLDLLSASGHVLARRALGPVGGSRRSVAGALSARSLSGRLPRGAVRARVTLTLATSLTNIDGANAPLVGFDRAVADNIGFVVLAPHRGPAPLRPPAARVPRYDHVFLFYFENQDVHAIVGNRRQAPYYNSLLAQGSQLGNLFAEEHPSDANYLALAGGSAFGVPLDDPLEYDSQYTIHARNIGDLVNSAHETWKAYNESAAGPCDDTVHGYYWDDDLPFLYFSDIRRRPAYCATHVLPLESMAPDLASAATTPSFVWVGSNDCDDMEGCGIRAGDRFLQQQLGQIMRSPAWRTQRSLAIITWDEDSYDHERPAQWVPTLVLGSRGVKRGFVSPVRYTHYSLLRTIEGALGLGHLTANDLYAQPADDAFAPASPMPKGIALAASRPRPTPAASRPRATSAARRPPATLAAGHAQTAFVVGAQAGTVTPIALATRRAGPAIRVGRSPQAVALTPDDRTAFVVNAGSDSVTPISTATRRAGAAISVGHDPRAIAVTPDGATAYVANSGSDSVTPVDVRTGAAGAPIPVGSHPRTLVLTPDGRTLYVLDWSGAAVTPIDTSTHRALAPIPVGAFPAAAAVDPGGRTVYVASYGANTVTPIATATNTAGPPIPAGQAPNALALTPDGATAEVVDGATDRVTPIDTARGRARRPVSVGSSPTAVAMHGSTVFVVSTIAGTVTPISTVTGRAGHPISVGTYSYPTSITLAPGGTIAAVLGTYDGTVRLLDTRTRTASKPIKVGALPVAVAITR